MRRFMVGRRNYLIAAGVVVVLIGIFAVTVSAGWVSGFGSNNKSSHDNRPSVSHQADQTQSQSQAQSQSQTQTQTPVSTSIPQAPPASPGATKHASPAATPTPPPLPAVAALLPTDNDVPQGLVPSSDDKRDVTQVANQLSGGATGTPSASALHELQSWGWSEAIERQFRPAGRQAASTAPAATAPQGQQTAKDGVQWMWVVIYRFGTPAGAINAFDAFTAQAKAINGMSETATSRIGDETLGLTRKGSDGLFHLWFRIGTDVVWIGGTSTNGYPRADIEATAQTIWARDIAQQASTKPAATPTAAASVVKVGDTATVSDGANLRQSASANATVVAIVGNGDEIKITGPTVVADGHAWWPVTYTASGQTGFIASGLVVPTGS